MMVVSYKYKGIMAIQLHKLLEQNSPLSLFIALLVGLQ